MSIPPIDFEVGSYLNSTTHLEVIYRLWYYARLLYGTDWALLLSLRRLFILIVWVVLGECNQSRCSWVGCDGVYYLSGILLDVVVLSKALSLSLSLSNSIYWIMAPTKVIRTAEWGSLHVIGSIHTLSLLVDNEVAYVPNVFRSLLGWPMTSPRSYCSILNLHSWCVAVVSEVLHELVVSVLSRCRALLTHLVLYFWFYVIGFICYLLIEGRDEDSLIFLCSCLRHERVISRR